VERHVVLEFRNPVQERGGIEMIGNIGHAERKLPTGVSSCGRLGGDFRVFHNGVFFPFQGDHTDWFGGLDLAHGLRGAIDLSGDAETDEDRVCNSHETIVHAVRMDVEDIALSEISENGVRRIGCCAEGCP